MLLALVIIEGEIYTLSNIRQKHPVPLPPAPSAFPQLRLDTHSLYGESFEELAFVSV